MMMMMFLMVTAMSLVSALPSQYLTYPGDIMLGGLFPIHKRGEAYDRLKRALTERMTEEVLRLLPQLRGRVEYCDLGTPLSSNFYLGTRHGEAYGLAHTPARFAQPWLTPRMRRRTAASQLPRRASSA